MIQCCQLYKLASINDWLLLNFEEKHPSPKLLFMTVPYILLIKPFWKNSFSWQHWLLNWRARMESRGGGSRTSGTLNKAYVWPWWLVYTFFYQSSKCSSSAKPLIFFCLLYHRGKKAYVFQTYRQFCNHLIFVLDMVFPIKIKLYSWATIVEIGVTFFHK